MISCVSAFRSKYPQCSPGAGLSLFLFYVLSEELVKAADHLDNEHENADPLKLTRSSASIFDVVSAVNPRDTSDSDMTHWEKISIAPQ